MENGRRRRKTKVDPGVSHLHNYVIQGNDGVNEIGDLEDLRRRTQNEPAGASHCSGLFTPYELILGLNIPCWNAEALISSWGKQIRLVLRQYAFFSPLGSR